MDRNDRPYPQIDGIIPVCGDLHAKTPEALEKLLAHLSEDYDVKNCMEDKDHPHRGWYARLKDSVLQCKVKCEFCNHLNDTLGCRVHGFTCKGCGKVIYREYLPNAPIEFAFDEDRKGRVLRFLIHSYSVEEKALYVYAKPQKSSRLFRLDPEQAGKLLEEFKHCYERVTNEKGHKLLKFFLPRGCGMVYKDENGNEQRLKINTYEVGHPPVKYLRDANGNKVKDEDGFSVYVHDETTSRAFYNEVQLFKGQEIQGGGDWDLPVNASYMIYDTYKNAPEKRDANLSRRIIHAARQVTDCGYYYQDGSQAFYDGQMQNMAKYIEHFTDLDAADFRENFWRYCAKDGPGFIQDFAFWVKEQTGIEQYVENRPNVMNVVIGIHKAFNGQRLSYREMKAMKDGIADDAVRTEYCDKMGRIVRSGPSRKRKGK